MPKFVRIVFQIAILYFIYRIGVIVQEAFHLFIPGSVIGMTILIILLWTNIVKVSWIAEGAQLMINHLPLFFIPATVGTMTYFGLFSGKGFLLVPIVLISTILTMVCSGLVSQWLVDKKVYK